MDPLIITAACGYTRPPDDSRGEDIGSIVEAVVEAAHAGAAIAQVRAPHTIDPQTGRPLTDLNAWIEIVKQVRARCDILIHAGVAAMPIDQRIALFEAVSPEIASFLLGHHSIVTRGLELNSLRPRVDALRLLRAHLATGVRPDFEIFHAGSIRNLEYLLTQLDLARPLAMTLFFGWDGGEWSPATVEELLHRRRIVPANSIWTITAAGEEQTLLHVLAIGRGGHVRAGLGDYPYVNPGIYAHSTVQFVTRIVRLAEDLRRDVATPAQAARLLGISHRGAAR
jgi:3-keto-5-aminohexanoate cleavage enzyme